MPYLGPMPQPTPPPGENEQPPILGTWTNIYLTVLGLHVALILLVYLFSQVYS